MFRYHRFDDPVILYSVKETGTRMLGLAVMKNAVISPATTKFIELISERLGR